MGTVEDVFTAFLLIIGLATGVCIYVAFDDMNESKLQQEEDFGLGSVVTTTAEYEYLTNDTFIGVVVGGDCVYDSSLTVRSKDGVERQITIEFLEPVA